MDERRDQMLLDENEECKAIRARIQSLNIEAIDVEFKDTRDQMDYLESTKEANNTRQIQDNVERMQAELHNLKYEERKEDLELFKWI